MTTCKNKQGPCCTQTLQKSQQLGDDTRTKSSYCAQLEEKVFLSEQSHVDADMPSSVTGYINKKSVSAKGAQWGGSREGMGWEGGGNLQRTNSFFIYLVFFPPILCKDEINMQCFSKWIQIWYIWFAALFKKLMKKITDTGQWHFMMSQRDL